MAVKEIERMRAWRLSDVPITENEDDDYKDPQVRRNTKAKIFLAYTSNMISSGVREVIRYLVQHKHVDVLVTTGGGIEEDLMKCLAPHYLGDFGLKGAALRKKGINRIGTLLVPHRNYCQFEDGLPPLPDGFAEPLWIQKGGGRKSAAAAWRREQQGRAASGRGASAPRSSPVRRPTVA